MNDLALVPGSLGAIAKQNNTSIAETFIGCDVVIIVDTSGSMATKDSRGGRSRYDIAVEELKALQGNMPGKIAVIAFSDDVVFNPAGIAEFLGCGTDLARALSFVKVADVPGIRFILISDGYPDNPEAALRIAKTFKSKIDVIYTGPEESPTGRDFLMRLASVIGGKSVTADRAKELQAGIKLLLGTG